MAVNVLCLSVQPPNLIDQGFCREDRHAWCMGFDYQPFAYGVYVCASPSLVNTREHNASATRTAAGFMSIMRIVSGRI